MNPNLSKKCVAEFIGTFTLIFIGVGAINNISAIGLLGVAFAHGLALVVMISATAGISGGHLNPAVTFGLFVGGKIKPAEAVAYWVSQLAGGAAAGFLLLIIYGVNGKSIVTNGTPDLGKDVTFGTGVLVEIVLTFFLVFVVYGTAVDPRAPKIGGIAIGLTVAMDILLGGPISGASMNPARTLGPALASGHWDHHMVYWLGPLIGGGLAGLLYSRFLMGGESK